MDAWWEMVQAHPASSAIVCFGVVVCAALIVAIWRQGR